MRHPSLDDRFDPAARIVDYDAAWPTARPLEELSYLFAPALERRALDWLNG